MSTKQKQERVKEEPKQYMFLGYGNYNNYGGGPPGRMMDAGLARSPQLFDLFFEALGIKKKTRRRSEGEE